jgi:hypothetical protein
MQECKVLGIKKVDFTDQSTGQQITGDQLWVLSDTRDPVWNGREVIKIWVPSGCDMSAKLPQLENDDIILVEFNRRGKAIAFDLA